VSLLCSVAGANPPVNESPEESTVAFFIAASAPRRPPAGVFHTLLRGAAPGGALLAARGKPSCHSAYQTTERYAHSRVSHLNFQNAAKTKVDPAAIDAEIANIYGVGAKPTLRTLEKDDYSDEAEKQAGTQFTVTVIGFRNKANDTWDLYYQRQISRVVRNPQDTGSLVQNILQDRQVQIQ
jgi:hypothetical protein